MQDYGGSVLFLPHSMPAQKRNEANNEAAAMKQTGKCGCRTVVTSTQILPANNMHCAA